MVVTKLELSLTFDNYKMTKYNGKYQQITIGMYVSLIYFIQSFYYNILTMSAHK